MKYFQVTGDCGSYSAGVMQLDLCFLKDKGQTTGRRDSSRKYHKGVCIELAKYA